MAVEHTSRPLFGVQFHPESIGTPEGDALLGRFLAVRGAQERARAA
jgi:anthranilate/para-aminobenzoate synthase component II